MALIRYELAMVKGCPFIILDTPVSFLQLFTLTFLMFFMFLKFPRIYYRFINSHLILTPSLNFTQIIFFWRIDVRRSCCFTARIVMVSINFHLLNNWWACLSSSVALTAWPPFTQASQKNSLLLSTSSFQFHNHWSILRMPQLQVQTITILCVSLSLHLSFRAHPYRCLGSCSHML